MEAGQPQDNVLYLTRSDKWALGFTTAHKDTDSAFENLGLER